jgi:hypothetical protein
MAMNTLKEDHPTSGPSQSATFSHPCSPKRTSTGMTSMSTNSQISLTIRTTINGNCPHCNHVHDHRKIRLRQSQGQFYKAILCEECHLPWVTIGKPGPGSFHTTSSTSRRSSNKDEFKSTVAPLDSSPAHVGQTFGAPRIDDGPTSSVVGTGSPVHNPLTPPVYAQVKGTALKSSNSSLAANTNKGLARRLKGRTERFIKGVKRQAKQFFNDPRKLLRKTSPSVPHGNLGLQSSPRIPLPTQSQQSGDDPTQPPPDPQISVPSSPSEIVADGKGKQKAQLNKESVEMEPKKINEQPETGKNKEYTENLKAKENDGPRKEKKETDVDKKTNCGHGESAHSSVSYMQADPNGTTQRLGPFNESTCYSTNVFFSGPDPFPDLTMPRESPIRPELLAGLEEIGVHLSVSANYPFGRNSFSSQGSTNVSTEPLPPSHSVPPIDTSVGHPQQAPAVSILVGGLHPPTPISAEPE